ncbi:MAG: putative toxin-antitoxin system toxin component, PIN family [Thermoplasmata archaeon]|nr:putative toxin-antitoxin system toxin component, PIN family [Thermoplasmata archaeon]
MRVVADTNVLISGIFWDGNESDVLKRFKTKEIMNLISPDIVEEFEGVLSRRKFELTEEEIDSAIGEVLSFSKVIRPKIELNVIKQDPSDNRILECAIYGKADYIISGDKHLLDLKEFKGISTVTAMELLKILQDN